jgi:excisionase family DNA binding protein
VNELIDRLIPIADAAEALGTSLSTVRWWVQIGKIGSNKPGRQRLIPVSEVNRIIRETRTPARNQDQSLTAAA